MPRGVYPRTEAHRLANSIGHRGRLHTEEEKRRISLSCKGGNKTSFKKGEKTRLGAKHTIESRMKMRASQTGKIHGAHSLETRRKIGEAQLAEKNHQWRGGKTKEYRIVRGSFAYREWKKAVLNRDGHKCVLCSSDTQLEVDHIEPFCLVTDKRLLISNGRTLCRGCHRKTPSWGKKKDTYATL